MHSRKEGAAIRKEVYRFIARYITVHVYPPSYKEIADALGISRSTVRRHIRSQERSEHYGSAEHE